MVMGGLLRESKARRLSPNHSLTVLTAHIPASQSSRRDQFFG